MGGILVCRKSSIGHEAPSAVWYRYQAGRGFPARPHGQGKEALHFRWACLCAGEISAAGLYAKGAGYCLCRGRPAGHAGDSGNGCKKQVLVQCGCNAHVASGFFCVKIIFDNVDFQLFLTQILYLNSKRVKIGGEQELSTSQAAKDLELTPTSISRASKQLEEMGLLHIKKLGVQRILQSEDSPKTLFQKAGDKLLNPIKRTVYIPKELVGTDLVESGYSALAEYSMLNAPNVKCYATERISQWKDVMTNSLQDSQVQVAVEMWRYNPRKLSTRNIVDELSLALALREDAGERVEEAVEEMLNELWRKIDGYRN